MNHGEVLNIWKQNGLKLPELPLDECIFPNAERLLKIEQINKELLEALKEMVKYHSLHDPISYKALEAIAKAERKE